ncbi:hypothetical protein DMH03_17760 [Amycolatopsis sp. WAC 01376]|uniref:hypothetical protein n=1 Tax=Amycolatopsis sp. WAC 01376 TaxID=2203195 RepID=UPI000F7A8C44|nr:hypothetical protein [Amycolatopsis sp. WAC 01376]RSM60595.1 hypothetical protein DMH03_17760 [Amycolatopsis sp. WAC 01376]
MSEQEYHPSAQFNPAHPDNAAWANGSKPVDMPAEAGIVEQFKGDEAALANAPAEAGIVAAHTDAEDDGGKPKTSRKR